MNEKKEWAYYVREETPGQKPEDRFCSSTFSPCDLEPQYTDF